jgi:hypothetical protein
MVPSDSPTRFGKNYGKENTSYNSSEGDEPTYSEAQPLEGKKRNVTTALIVSSAVLFGAAIVITIAALNFERASSVTSFASSTNSEFDSKGR